MNSFKNALTNIYIENPCSTQPEKLYRRCGFYGDDVWHVLRKSKVGDAN